MTDDHYELKCVHSGIEITAKFSADVDVYTLQAHLMSFLAGTGWCKTNLDKLFNMEDGE